MNAHDLAIDHIDAADRAIAGQSVGGQVSAFKMAWAFRDTRARGIDAIGLCNAGTLELVLIGRHRHCRNIDRLTKVIGRHIPDKPAGLLGIDNRVLASSIRILVSGEHHHRWVKGQILPLAVWGEIVHTVSADR